MSCPTLRLPLLRASIESRIAKHLVFNADLSGVVGRRETPRFNSGGSDGDSGYEVGWFSVAHQVIGMYPFLPETYDGYYTGAIASNQVFPNSPLAALALSGNKKTNSFNGILTGGLTAAAAGICAAVFFGCLMALLFKPREKG